MVDGENEKSKWEGEVRSDVVALGVLVVDRRRGKRSKMHETLLEKQNQKVRSILQLRNQSRN